MLNLALFTRAVLVVIVFYTNGETGTIMQQYNTVDECKIAAEAAIKAMADVKEIKDGVTLCSTRIKLLTDENGKELELEASLQH